MAALVWDRVGERFYESGVDHGVVYPMDESGAYPNGYAWNGLTTVTESPSGAEPTKLWADNIAYAEITSAEEFGLTIEAYTYPPKFGECDGSAEVKTGVMIGQQKRKKFGFSYRTKIGNDVDGLDKGYKLHLVYGCSAMPSEKGNSTINDSPDATTFSWEVKTTPAEVTGYKPTSHIVIDSTKVDPGKLAEFLKTLYGGSGEPTLPNPDAVIAAFAE